MFIQLNEKNGLSNNTVNCMIQDHEGFVWIGTDNGLNRYDGYNFKQYHNNSDDSLSLIHDHITCFFLAADSTLWIGTPYGACKYRSETDDFQQFDVGYQSGFVRGFYEDSLENLFVVNDRSQIYQVHENNVHLIIDYNFHNYTYLRDEDGNFWFGVQNGVHFVNSHSGSQEIYDLSQLSSKTDQEPSVFVLLEDGDKIWIGTRTDGIFILDKKTRKISAYQVPLTFIKTIVKDEEGNLLIGDTQGLKIYNPENRKILDYKPLVDMSENYMAENAVDAIMIDRQGNLWLGVKFRGINLAYKDKGFRHIDYVSEDPYDKARKTIISIVADSDHDVWFGSYTNGLERVNLQDKSSEYFGCFRESDPLECGSVYELYRDKDSVLWIGSYDGSLQRINPSTGKPETYVIRDKSGKIDLANDIRSICEDEQGNYWILPHGNGLYKWNPENQDFTWFRMDEDDSTSLINDWGYHAMCDSRGNVWVATPYGLSVTRDGNTFTNYLNIPGDTSSLITNEVLTVFEDSYGQIWAGTRDGLCKYNAQEDNFSRFTSEDGLIDNYVCSILEDGNHNLWISTIKGLSKYDPKSGDFYNYDIGDGIQDNEFMDNACALTPSGYMIFGSVNRGTWFHPDSLSVNDEPPQVYLTDFKLFNKSVPIEPDREDAILKTNIRYTKEIVLNHKQKVISFSFIALNHIHPEKNRFAYKMEKFDDEWTYPESNREVTYTNLVPGEYTFRVIASNDDGYWNEDGISLKLTITPPFWQTLWFRFLIVLVILSLIFLIFYLRVRSIRQSNIILEKTVDERTRELQSKNTALAQRTEELNQSNSLLEERQKQVIEQSKELKEINRQLKKSSEELTRQKSKLEDTNLQLSELNAMKDKFFSIIGHDLKNPVGVIRGFVELLTEGFSDFDDERKLKYLHHILRTVDKTSNLLENLLNWAKSQSGTLKVNPENLNIHLLMQNVMALYRDEAEKKQIQFITEMDDQHMLAYADRNMVDTVIRNLISNAVKFSHKKGEITLGCTKHNAHPEILVFVRDKGKGIPPEDIDKLFKIDSNFSTAGTEGETGTGLGLILCKEFIERCRGRIWVESKEGEGSSFYFTLPQAEG